MHFREIIKAEKNVYDILLCEKQSYQVLIMACNTLWVKHTFTNIYVYLYICIEICAEGENYQMLIDVTADL